MSNLSYDASNFSIIEYTSLLYAASKTRFVQIRHEILLYYILIEIVSHYVEITGHHYGVANGRDQVTNGAYGVANECDEVTNGAYGVANGCDELINGAYGVANGCDRVTNGAYGVANGRDELTNDAYEVPMPLTE